MGAAFRGFYLNTLETGVQLPYLSKLLSTILNFKDVESTIQSLDFLILEGDRSSYEIVLPHLISSVDPEEFETIIRKQFMGIDRFIDQGNNLYQFLQYVTERGEPIIWINDLERGIWGWDLGRLVGLTRAALELGLISRKEAWNYIELAGEKCSDLFSNNEELDKSYLIGQAMRLNSISQWEKLLQCYSLLRSNEE